MHNNMIENLRNQYIKKISKPKDILLKVIQAGNKIFIGSGAAEPMTLVETLLDIEKYFTDTEVVHIVELGTSAYSRKALAEPFRKNAFFIGPNIREQINQGRADFTPLYLSEVPGLIYSGHIRLDVALISVAPPDKYGFCSLGVSVDVVKAAAEMADIVIAEVNKKMPRTLGNSFIHIDNIDYIVESDRNLPELKHGKPDEVAKIIGKYVAQLIPDGSTIQIGIGTIPDAVLENLMDKHDLGIHTEMFSDGLIDLVEAGVVTNQNKKIHRGKIIATFCMGTQRLYEFVDDNPLVEFHPCDYTNDPYIIRQNERMISINAALEIDLTGQVCSDSLGEYFYSGIGGQVDFVRGAKMAKYGKSIIVMPSTARNGEVSRIKSRLSPGAGVVTTRGDVQFVATEFGIVNLHGRNLRERAMLLTNIAHPKFRDELLDYAKDRNLAYFDQLPMGEGAKNYPYQFELNKKFSDEEIFFRPIKPSDELLEREFFYKLSPETIYFRFFQKLQALPHEQLQKYTTIDYFSEMALVGLVGEPGSEKIIAIGRYIVDDSDGFAEVSFVLADKYQSHGIGTFLLNYLVEIALQRGINGFKADVLAANKKMLSTFAKLPYTMETNIEDEVYSLRIPFKKRERQSVRFRTIKLEKPVDEKDNNK